MNIIGIKVEENKYIVRYRQSDRSVVSVEYTSDEFISMSNAILQAKNDSGLVDAIDIIKVESERQTIEQKMFEVEKKIYEKISGDLEKYLKSQEILRSSVENILSDHTAYDATNQSLTKRLSFIEQIVQTTEKLYNQQMNRIIQEQKTIDEAYRKVDELYKISKETGELSEALIRNFNELQEEQSGFKKIINENLKKLNEQLVNQAEISNEIVDNELGEFKAEIRELLYHRVNILDLKEGFLKEFEEILIKKYIVDKKIENDLGKKEKELSGIIIDAKKNIAKVNSMVDETVEFSKKERIRIGETLRKAIDIIPDDKEKMESIIVEVSKILNNFNERVLVKQRDGKKKIFTKVKESIDNKEKANWFKRKIQRVIRG